GSPGSRRRCGPRRVPASWCGASPRAPANRRRKPLTTQPPNAPPPPGSPGNTPNNRPYRPRNDLERYVVRVIVAVYNAGTTPEPMGIARALIMDPAFIGIVMVPGTMRDRILLRGCSRIVYNVMRSLRFIDGPHQGTKACHAVPVT